MKRKRIVVLGATGSIGESALKVARDIPERMEIVGLAAKGNARKLAAQANLVRPEALCLVDETKLEELRAALEYQPVDFFRRGRPRGNLLPDERRHGAGRGRRDRRLAAGAGGDRGGQRSRGGEQGNPGHGGRDRDARSGARKAFTCLPVDSASTTRSFSVWKANVQSPKWDATLNVESWTLDSSDLRRIILTASGGPFRETPDEQFASITPEQALKHPTWNMGPKITIDSATLFNKGLEMIEAHWLFGVEMARVEVVIHPQSIVHSMVEFADGSVLAQLSHSDMCFPIQYAVTWPDRVPNTLPPLDFGKLQKLEFAAPRLDAFPALNLARRAGETGGTLPAVMNAANEVAVSAFLDRRIAFPRIWQVVEEVMNRHASVANPTLDAILEADRWARATAVETLNRQDR